MKKHHIFKIKKLNYNDFNSQNQTYINPWLYTTITMVVLMIIIGGITRLTDSGLSMVEWRPIWGFLPPISDEEWKRVFLTLHEFTRIYF